MRKIKAWFSECFSNQTVVSSHTDIIERKQQPFSKEKMIGQEKDEKKISEYSHLGLPNPGTLCYLIAILQSFYSMKKLREHLIQVSENSREGHEESILRREKVRYSYAIGSILQAIQNGMDSKTKESLLQKLAQMLFDENHSVKKGEHQDLLNVLNFILLQLKKEDKTIERFYEIKSRKWCECGSMKKNMIHKQTLVMLNEKCEDCDKNISQEAISYPPYLIRVPEENAKFYPPVFKLETENRKEVLYHEVAFVYYEGDRKKGHYTTFREYASNQWLQLNDNYVRQASVIDPEFDKRRLCIFEILDEEEKK